jgi:hypothetical protein
MNDLLDLANIQLLLEEPPPCYDNPPGSITSSRAFLHPRTSILHAGNGATSLRNQIFPTALRSTFIEWP